MPEYSLVLLFIFFIGFSLQYILHIKLYKSCKHLLVTNGTFLLIATIWDNVAISRGHWSFGQKFLLGPKIMFMPIEEFGFVLIVPYVILVLFKIFEKFFPSSQK